MDGLLRPAGAALALLLLLASPAVPASATGNAVADIWALAGAGFDSETAEESPFRLLAGLRLSDPVIDLRLSADCGLPWEPSARLDAGFAVIDTAFLRLGIRFAGWVRAYGTAATETGTLVAGSTEIGPRVLALAAAGGFSARNTYYPAIAGRLSDSFPWARVGVASRPVEQARFELAVTSDGPLAFWLRTSFELSGSWRFPTGVRIGGMLAARYTDFFTLTAHLDGFDARATVVLPITGGAP